MRTTPNAITSATAPIQRPFRCTRELYEGGARFACDQHMKFAPLALAALLLLACPGPRREDYSQSAPHQTSTTTANAGDGGMANPVVPPQNERPSMRIGGSAPQTVNVELTEYSIDVPRALPAGKYTFHIVNAGKIDHSFVIEGNGTHLALAAPLKRGDAADLGVELKAGTYDVYCPVDRHKGKGMSSAIAVK
jgi:hypothetical protein